MNVLFSCSPLTFASPQGCARRGLEWVRHSRSRCGDGNHVPASSLQNLPNSANAWTSSCLARIYLGDCETAIDHFNRSQRLNPLDQSHHVHWNIVGMAYFAGTRFEDADAAAAKALKARPTYPPGLRLKVATCGVLGRIEEGRAHVERLLAVHPECSLAWIREFWGPLMRRSPAALTNYIEGSRLVGLPEEPRRSA